MDNIIITKHLYRLIVIVTFLLIPAFVTGNGLLGQGTKHKEPVLVNTAKPIRDDMVPLLSAFVEYSMKCLNFKGDTTSYKTKFATLIHISRICDKTFNIDLECVDKKDFWQGPVSIQIDFPECYYCYSGNDFLIRGDYSVFFTKEDEIVVFEFEYDPDYFISLTHYPATLVICYNNMFFFKELFLSYKMDMYYRSKKKRK